MPIGLYLSILKPFIIPLGFTATATICLLMILKNCLRGYLLCQQLSWQNFSFYFVLNLDTGPEILFLLFHLIPILIHVSIMLILLNIPSVVIPPFSFWISIPYFFSSYHTFPAQIKKPDKNLHFYPVPVLFQQLHQLFKKAF